MNIIFKVGGKILVFAWKNRSWIIPIAREGYLVYKRWRKINRLKKAAK
jgi:hypothetical protein